MELVGKHTTRRMCHQCLFLLTTLTTLTTLTVVTSSPVTGHSNERDSTLAGEPQSLHASHVDQVLPYTSHADNSPSDEEMAQVYLHHYGFFKAAKPLRMLDGDDGRRTGSSRQEREAKSDAIRKFQSYFGLPPTGQLDPATIQLMKRDRCGVEDIPDDQPDPQAPQAFNIRDRKWEKSRLTWKLSGATRQLDQSKQQRVLGEALGEWARVAPLYFQHRPQSSEVDIDMLFGARSHGDKYPFDGRSKVLAHAYGPDYSTPIRGDVHFDDDEIWTTDKAGRGTDLLVVATHEIGHSLGLAHSRDPNALMYPYYGQTNSLGQDDIRAIQYLYGKRVGLPPTTRRPVTSRPVTARPTRRPRIRTTTTTTTTPPPTTSDTSGCHAHFDVVIKDFHSERDVYTGILGDQVFRFNQAGLLPGYPTSLHLIYPGAPVGADAVFTNPQTRATYFVQDTTVYRYTDFVLDEGFPRAIDDTHFPETVRFVLPYVNAYGQTERMFVFGSTWFWEYNFDDKYTSKPHPYQISQYWRDVRSDVKYVVTWTDNNMYFISPDSHVVLTHHRRQMNVGREKGHPVWLQNVCKQAAFHLPQDGSSATRPADVTSLLLTAVLSVLLFLRLL